MEPQAIARLGSETGNWLNRGRANLLQTLLRRFGRRRGGEVLELGAGHGQHIDMLREWGEVDAVEVDAACWPTLEACAGLRDLYRRGLPGLAVPRRYDIVCALDVIEHIADDSAALTWVADHLKPGGVFIGTVPAYQWMFGPHDRANRHFRRYTNGRLLAALPGAFRVDASGYFNTTLLPAAIAAKLIWGARQGDRPADKQSSNLPPILDRLGYAVLATEARLIGAGLRPPAGLSVFWVATLAAAN